MHNDQAKFCDNFQITDDDAEASYVRQVRNCNRRLKTPLTWIVAFSLFFLGQFVYLIWFYRTLFLNLTLSNRRKYELIQKKEKITDNFQILPKRHSYHGIRTCYLRLRRPIMQPQDHRDNGFANFFFLYFLIISPHAKQ